MRISGSGLSISITAPSTMADRAARRQNAVRREFGLQREQREGQHQQRRAQPVDGQHG